MDQTDQARLRGWRKSFAETQPTGPEASRRLQVSPSHGTEILRNICQEIEVLLSELSSVRPGTSLYQGGENRVLFSADLSQVKSQLKKEQNSLRKKIEKEKTSSEALTF